MPSTMVKYQNKRVYAIYVFYNVSIVFHFMFPGSSYGDKYNKLFVVTFQEIRLVHIIMKYVMYERNWLDSV